MTSDGTWNYYADKNGNITQKINPSTGEIWNYSFDNRNRLISVTDTTSAGLQMQGTYTHDALGQRVQKAVWTASSGTTTTSRFAYDQRQIIADLDGSSALTMRYLLGMRVLERIARISSAGTVAWLLPDRLGSVRNVVNGSGSTIDTILFDGFGKIVSQSSPSNGGFYLFTSYRIDPETGLVRADMSWRYYDPVTGRWTTVDPIGFGGGDANLWRYVKNNATNSADPSGMVPEQCTETQDMLMLLMAVETGVDVIDSWANVMNVLSLGTSAVISPLKKEAAKKSSKELKVMFAKEANDVLSKRIKRIEKEIADAKASGQNCERKVLLLTFLQKAAKEMALAGLDPAKMCNALALCAARGGDTDGRVAFGIIKGRENAKCQWATDPKNGSLRVSYKTWGTAYAIGAKKWEGVDD